MKHSLSMIILGSLLAVQANAQVSNTLTILNTESPLRADNSPGAPTLVKGRYKYVALENVISEIDSSKTRAFIQFYGNVCLPSSEMGGLCEEQALTIFRSEPKQFVYDPASREFQLVSHDPVTGKTAFIACATREHSKFAGLFNKTNVRETGRCEILPFEYKVENKGEYEIQPHQIGTVRMNVLSNVSK